MGSTVFSQFSYICLPFRPQVTLDATNGSINPYPLVTKHSNGKSPIYFNHFPSCFLCLKKKPPYAIGHEMFQPCSKGPKGGTVSSFVVPLRSPEGLGAAPTTPTAVGRRPLRWRWGQKGRCPPVLKRVQRGWQENPLEMVVFICFNGKIIYKYL